MSGVVGASVTATPPGTVAAARTIVAYAMRENLRRKVFFVILALTGAFILLYGLGAHFAFRELSNRGLEGSHFLNQKALVGGTIFGLGVFATLFLGAVLAVFLTNGIVRGDSDSGLLQPLVVRPVGRATFLVARFLGAIAVTSVYVIVVYLVIALITNATGDYAPGHLIAPGLLLVFSIGILAAISVLTSVLLSATAQGITVFMVFGAGLVGGLLGQIGRAIPSDSLKSIANAVTTALPFEALYQGALYLVTTNQDGVTRTVLELGPFGGSKEAGAGLIVFSLFYIATIGVAAVALFRRRDL